MIGIREVDGRFWSAPGLTWDEALKTEDLWKSIGIHCRTEDIQDNRQEAIAMLADFDAEVENAR